MHRLVQENLEEILKGGSSKGHAGDHPASRHLAECAECREEVAAMGEHSALLRRWRDAGGGEPRAGFYARVLERIETQGPGSIWNLFFDSLFGRRLALASLALAVLLSGYLISTEPLGEPQLASFSEDAVEILPVPMGAGEFVALHDPAGVMLPGDPDDNSVLVNLVTYREQ